MNLSMLNGVNIALDAYSIAICLIIFVSIFSRKNKRNEKPAFWFAITCIVNVLFSSTDIFTWISEGTDAAWKLIALPLSSFLYYFFGLLIFIVYLKYINSYYSQFRKISKLYFILSVIASVIYLTLLILTNKFGLFYEILPGNIYKRGRIFIVTVLIQVFFYIEILTLVLKNMKYIPGHQTIAFCTFVFIPVFAWLIQLFNYGIALNVAGVTLSFFIIFINLNHRLEENLDKTNNELKIKNKTIINMQDNTIMSLSNLVENRDTDTGHHVRRTRDYVTLIAEQSKRDNVYSESINDVFITLLSKSAPLHDIGKIIVPDNVLKKPGKLTVEEFELMKTHAKEGGRIINEVLGIGVDAEYLRVSTEIATGHHERWDGRGYPYNLVGTAIPLSARIMAIADVFDALVSKRCYKEKMSIDEAFKIIEEESGSHFDPILVEEFLKIKDDITHVVNRFSD